MWAVKLQQMQDGRLYIAGIGAGIETTSPEVLSTDEKLAKQQEEGNIGLNSWLGEGGRQLSGGELRRLAIARALLHDAPLVLLLTQEKTAVSRMARWLLICFPV